MDTTNKENNQKYFDEYGNLLVHRDWGDEFKIKTTLSNNYIDTDWHVYKTLPKELEQYKKSLKNKKENKKNNQKKVKKVKKANKYDEIYKSAEDMSFHIDKNISSKIEGRLKKKVKKYLKHPQNTQYNDRFFAEIIVGLYKNYILFNKDTNKWLWWTGKYWKEDEEQIIARICIKTIFELQRSFEMNSAHERIVKIVAQYGNYHEIRNLISMLSTYCSCQTSDFDNEKHLLNVKNGTINLKTKIVQRHKPSDMITQFINVDYEKHPEGNQFKIFIRGICNEDTELIEYLQAMYGYAITGEISEQCLFFEHGSGANGKSTLNSLVSDIVSNYSETVSYDLFKKNARSSSSSPTPELEKLRGKRIAFCAETSTDLINEAKIKEITGGERITARALYSKPITYMPQFTLIFETNNNPTINGADYGIWRRIIVIPFLCKFKKNPNLKNVLLQEKTVILKWLVDGAYNYYQNGLPECRAVKKATEKYMEDEDTVGAFVKYCLKEDKDNICFAKELYAAYEKFCAGECNTPLDIKKFKSGMEAKGYINKRINKGRAWMGVKLKKFAVGK